MKNVSDMENIEALKANIEHKKNVIRELNIFVNQLDNLRRLEDQGYRINQQERRLLQASINSLVSQLIILNNSLPDILKNVSIYQKLPSKTEKKKGEKDLVSMQYSAPSLEQKQALVTVKKEDRQRFLKELNLTNSSLSKLKKSYSQVSEKVRNFKKPSFYAKTSNKLFLKLSNNLLNKEYFPNLGKELRKSNLPFISNTYLSMAFFTTLLSFIFSIFLLILLLFYNFSMIFPFLTTTESSVLIRLAQNFWIIFGLPAATFLAFYFYPSIEKKSIAGRINQELPFVVIHMSAIAGSGIEPSKIFKIIVLSREYPDTRKEVKKLLNQINLYGSDIVTALRQSARMTSSSKLSELFNGLATTISSGGGLKDFLDKRSETLIFDYRIERKKYTHTAETFMNIYISVVIAAPMILTILLVMIAITGMDFGLGISQISLLLVLGIAMINIFFLLFLHLKQPKY